MGACLILLMAGRSLLLVPHQFPDPVACEMAGASMRGATVVGHSCVPAVIFDCGRNPPIRQRQRE